MKNFHSKVVETVVHAITEFYNILDEAKENKKAISDTYNKEYGAMVLCQDNGHIKPLLFGKISKMHKVVAFIPRFA